MAATTDTSVDREKISPHAGALMEAWLNDAKPRAEPRAGPVWLLAESSYRKAACGVQLQRRQSDLMTPTLSRSTVVWVIASKVTI